MGKSFLVLCEVFLWFGRYMGKSFLVLWEVFLWFGKYKRTLSLGFKRLASQTCDRMEMICFCRRGRASDGTVNCESTVGAKRLMVQ